MRPIGLSVRRVALADARDVEPDAGPFSWWEKDRMRGVPPPDDSRPSPQPSPLGRGSAVRRPASKGAKRPGLRQHRPRSAIRSRIGASPIRISDLILAMLGLTLLGAFGLLAAAVLLGRALGH